MFIKKISSLASGLFLSGLFLFSSCKKDDSWRPEPSLSGSTNSLTISSTGQDYFGSDYSIQLLSSIKWTANSSEAWLKIPRPNGANDGFLVLKADSNFSEERKGKVTISGNGVDPFVIDVKQIAGVSTEISTILDLTKLPFSNGQIGLSITNALKQNITISASESWVTFSSAPTVTGSTTFSSNNSNLYVYVLFSENPGTTNRSSVISIKNKSGEVVKSYSFTQTPDTFNPLFNGFKWSLKRVTSYNSSTITNKPISQCIGDNLTTFTKSTSLSGTYLMDNGSVSSSCNEFQQYSPGTYSIGFSGGNTTLTSNFNYNYDNTDFYFVEKITADSLKLKSSSSATTFTRYEFLKVP